MTKIKERKNQPALYKAICKILYKTGVLPAEIDECMHWAFGPKAWYIPPNPEWIDNWNKVHGKLMRIKHGDKLVEILICVGTLFCSQKDKTYEMQRMRREKSN